MSRERFTVFGAGGFIGGALVRRLDRMGHEVRPVTRDTWPGPDANLGHVIHAIGMTADFRGRPLETAERQVVRLCEVLGRYRFRSLLYLSSTRVYKRAACAAEVAPVALNPSDPDDVYAATKLAAEAVCLSLPDPAVRVARLSNVYGPGMHPRSFLPSLLAEAAGTGRVLVRSDPASAKDYVHLDDVVSRLVEIALSGRHRLYNVARGADVPHAAIADALRRAGVTVSFAHGAPLQTFPPIDVSRASAEWGPLRRNLLDDMPVLLADHQRRTAA